MKYRKIVFVCTGNTCRSPMAEALLRDELKKRRIRWYQISSAGIEAQSGAPMSQNARAALTEAGIAFSPSFRARRVTKKTAENAYAVVCMTWKQMEHFGGASNVTCMYELTGREIPDPYGQGQDAYRATLCALKEGMPALIEALEIKDLSKK